MAPYQREQEERAEVGVHYRGVLLCRVVQAGLANAGADVVDEDVQQTAEVFVRLTTKYATTTTTKTKMNVYNILCGHYLTKTNSLIRLLHHGASEIASRWRSATAILLVLLIGVNEIGGHRLSCRG